MLLLFVSFALGLSLPPAPTARVNDYGGMLNASSRLELEQKLKNFEEATSNQIVVATFSSLEGETLEDFSIRLAEAWKLGKKGRDNGVLLLIFKEDRALRIETGYGLEGALPDAVSRSIIESKIIPEFRRGDFKAGIFSGVDAIIAATKGEYRAEPETNVGAILLLLLFFFLLGLFFWWVSRKAGQGITLGSGGLRRSSGWGRSTGWGGGGSSGSSWGGGGSSSWGSGGGGFSGGGGSFGGGGASGRW